MSASVCFGWSPYADARRLDHRDASRYRREVSAGNEVPDHRVDGQRSEASRSEQNDAGVCSWWVPAEVCELNVKSKEHAALSVGCRRDHCIRLGEQTFIGNR
jgi:hypothetical protein